MKTISNYKSVYTKQWAAVSTCELSMRVPPHICLLFNWIETLMTNEIDLNYCCWS